MYQHLLSCFKLENNEVTMIFQLRGGARSVIAQDLVSFGLLSLISNAECSNIYLYLGLLVGRSPGETRKKTVKYVLVWYILESVRIDVSSRSNSSVADFRDFATRERDGELVQRAWRRLRAAGLATAAFAQRIRRRAVSLRTFVKHHSRTWNAAQAN